MIFKTGVVIDAPTSFEEVMIRCAIDQVGSVLGFTFTITALRDPDDSSSPSGHAECKALDLRTKGSLKPFELDEQWSSSFKNQVKDLLLMRLPSKVAVLVCPDHIHVEW